jgi:hypothetical protein
MLAGYRISFKVDPRQMAAIKGSLDRLPVKIRGKVLRNGLRGWGDEVKRAVKANARRKDVRTRASIAVKTKTYKRGKVIWCGVGVRQGGTYDVGWKSHFHDQGYRPWQKGIKADGTPAKKTRLWNRNPHSRFVPFSYRRNWRKGMSRRSLGGVIYKTNYLTGPAYVLSHKVPDYVEFAVAEALREETRKNGN